MKRYRFAYLLVTLLLVLFIRPFISSQSVSAGLLDILLLLTLIAGTYTSIEKRMQVYVIGLLVTISTVTRITWHVSGADPLLAIFLISAIISYACVAWFLLKSLFSKNADPTVSHDTLCKAISVYLLLGVIWAFAYSLLEVLSPGSFAFGNQPVDGSHFDRFIGFSLTTLTTLGYGNISPATPQADSLATLQALTGQIYLAVVIARLVALQIMQADSRTDRNSPST